MPTIKIRIVDILALFAVVGGAVFLGLSDFRTKGKKSSGSAPLQMPQSNLNHGGLDDNATIIGVSFDGAHRAYPIHAFLRPDTHVVNDLLGRKPVTVTFCDIDDCVQVFTAPDQNRPLDIQVGGSNRLRERKMLLRIGKKSYWQDTMESLEKDGAPFPYAQVDYVRTTWGKWRQEHPDSDVYSGN